MKIARRDRAAATMIQKMWRGFFIRRQYLEIWEMVRQEKADAVTTIARYWRQHAVRRRQVEHERGRFSRAAIVIQRHGRG